MTVETPTCKEFEVGRRLAEETADVAKLLLVAAGRGQHHLDLGVEEVGPGRVEPLAVHQTRLRLR